MLPCIALDTQGSPILYFFPSKASSYQYQFSLNLAIVASAAFLSCSALAGSHPARAVLFAANVRKQIVSRKTFSIFIGLSSLKNLPQPKTSRHLSLLRKDNSQVKVVDNKDHHFWSNLAGG
jgi:hypothetical protein